MNLPYHFYRIYRTVYTEPRYIDYHYPFQTIQAIYWCPQEFAGHLHCLLFRWIQYSGIGNKIVTVPNFWNLAHFITIWHKSEGLPGSVWRLRADKFWLVFDKVFHLRRLDQCSQEYRHTADWVAGSYPKKFKLSNDLHITLFLSKYSEDLNS